MQYPNRLESQQEDCRDFLRTGRCKYGASCKYNHPANVQSGGGMKGPVNPSEPLFPVRPNEPTCQYYMKHGTCKFGQSCKFHHPPQSAVTAALLNGNTVVIRNGDEGPQHILLNSLSGESLSSGTTLQFLPQRPDEPDCIYFLRNGRCKYGATCRYHHPVSVQQRKQIDPHSSQGRRHPQLANTDEHGRTTSSRPIPPGYVQVGQPRGGQGPTTAVHIQSSGQYRHGGMATNMGRSDTGEYGVISTPMHQESSSSSIASSYETASSSIEYHSAPQQILDQNGGVWVRKRVGSGGSLNTLSENESMQNHAPMGFGGSGSHVSLVPNVSDSSLSRRHRAASIGSAGSASDGPYHEWSDKNLMSYEQSLRLQGNQGERMPSQATMRSHPPLQGRNREVSTSRHLHARTNERPPGYEDEGLSMMTSALLNMLDTPEDAEARSYASSHATPTTGALSPPHTPRSGPVRIPHDPSPQRDRAAINPPSNHPMDRPDQDSRYPYLTQRNPTRSENEDASEYHRRQREDHRGTNNVVGGGQVSGSWEPNWPNPSARAQQMGGNISVIQQATDRPGPHQSSSNVGLYLP